MNRAQKRAEVRMLQKRGVKREVARKIVTQYYNDTPLEEGTPVKINYEMMIRHPDWKIQRDDYKEWVEAHKDETFTVEWDATRKERNSNDKKLNVCLKEDTTEPKWLFNTATLIPLPKATINLDSGEKIDVTLDADVNVSTESGIDKINEAINEALEREQVIKEG